MAASCRNFTLSWSLSEYPDCSVFTATSMAPAGLCHIPLLTEPNWPQPRCSVTLHEHAHTIDWVLCTYKIHTYKKMSIDNFTANSLDLMPEDLPVLLAGKLPIQLSCIMRGFPVCLTLFKEVGVGAWRATLSLQYKIYSCTCTSALCNVIIVVPFQEQRICFHWFLTLILHLHWSRVFVPVYVQRWYQMQQLHAASSIHCHCNHVHLTSDGTNTPHL